MDWKIFASTFITIFLAELGDKTQFAAIALGGSGESKLSICLAVVSALSLAGILGVFAGHLIGGLLNPIVMKRLAGGLFVLMGVWIFFKG